MQSKTVASIAVVLGGVLWLTAGILLLKDSERDMIPLVMSGLALVMAGVLIAIKLAPQE